MGKRQLSKMALFRCCRIASILHQVPVTFLNGASAQGLLDLSHQRQYSRYPPHFREPVYQSDKNDNNTSIFYDETISKFINNLMKKGDKVTARTLVEKAFVKIKQIQFAKYHQAESDAERENIILNPVTILHKAIDNCMPILQLTSIKRGGSSYQVPIPITDKRSQALAMKWLILQSNEKERTTHFPEKLAAELIDASNNTGRVVKRKQDLHRQCEANRAYAHFRWG